MSLSQLLANRTLAIFFAFAALLDSRLALAGPANGGGGKSVVCPDSQHPIESVVLLDLWEGAKIRNQFPLPLTGGLRDNVSQLIERVIPAVGGDADPAAFRRELKRYAEPFFSSDGTKVLRLTDAGLNLTDDSYELIYPRLCKVEQVVNYQLSGEQILIDQKLFEKMDLTNQSALILHEAVYRWLRRFEGDTNSVRARRIVSYAMSHETPLVTPSVPRWQKGQVVCSGRIFDEASSMAIKQTILVFSEDKKSIDFRALNGEIPKGYTLAAQQPKQEWMDWFRKVFFDNKECTKANFDFLLDGPIEHDTSFQLVKDCRDGKILRRIGVRRPGESSYQFTDLRCRLLKEGEWGN